ncbi:MAG: F0F1 ATP synthase subunit B [Candidatus Electryonea clarkiae]|nr:F0F1 ATP synthase subunit B [Candidatus Electryonea clarkiae]MDP8286313.1 F0F1 ATP synthase subunit B [Candidatus Electryonea clarkiae]
MRELKIPVILALASLPAVTMASGGGLGDLISIAPGSMLWTLLTFFILLLVLWKFAWGPILSGLEAREDKIRTAIEQAQRDREEAAKNLREYEDKLKTATTEISERLSNADKEAIDRIERAKEDAKAEGVKLVEKARAEIEAEKTKIKAELRQEVADIASSIAAKAISESFEREDHMRIIKKKLDMLENES